VLLTDGADDAPEATRAAAAAAAGRGARVSVLGIAGDPGGELETLARAGGGTFAALSADDQDLEQIARAPELSLGASLSKREQQTDAWYDFGIWLLWVPLLLAPLAFRKGWATAALAVVCFQLPAPSAHAAVLDWFERPDQRGARAFADEEYEASAAAFEDPAWRAAALYRSGDFASAAAQLADLPDPESSYNRGNALAKSGQLEEALAAYDAALAVQPDDADARFNRDLVARLLEEQEPPPQDGSDAENSDDDERSEASEDSEGDGSAQPESPESDASGEDSGEEGEPQSGDEAEGGAESANGGEQPADADTEPADAGEESAGGDTEAEDAASPSAEPQGESSTAEAPSPGGAPDAPAEQAAAAGDASSPAAKGAPTSPEQQAAERWMSRLPDDPGGLLREKIRRDYQRKALARQQGEMP
jgi:Ca-activated chloride channel family protein